MDGGQKTVSDWGVHLLRHLQVLAASFPNHFPPDWVAELKRDHFYGRLPKWLKEMVAYLKPGPQVRTYSDYLRTTQEAEMEDSMELPWGPRTQATNTPPKPKATSFFLLRKFKGNQPIPKSLLCIWHIWKKRTSVAMKTKRVMIPAESMVLQKSLWYAWQGL